MSSRGHMINPQKGYFALSAIERDMSLDYEKTIDIFSDQDGNTCVLLR